MCLYSRVSRTISNNQQFSVSLQNDCDVCLGWAESCVSVVSFICT